MWEFTSQMFKALTRINHANSHQSICSTETELVCKPAAFVSLVHPLSAASAHEMRDKQSGIASFIDVMQKLVHSDASWSCSLSKWLIAGASFVRVARFLFYAKEIVFGWLEILWCKQEIIKDFWLVKSKVKLLKSCRFKQHILYKLCF